MTDFLLCKFTHSVCVNFVVFGNEKVTDARYSRKHNGMGKAKNYFTAERIFK